jgi:uridine kinase
MDINIINSKIMKNPSAFVEESERAYYTQIERLAGEFWDSRSEQPIILICGPSGSGKTTTALALERMLDNMGHQTHTISMDNYFKTLTPEELELSSRGEMDLESPSRLNIPLLNEQLNDMAEGRPVLLARYDFRNSRSLKGECVLERKKDELVILEGIHSLNPDVIKIPRNIFHSIYVSIKTSFTDDNNVLHPERIRLIRRLLRDSSHRGRSFKDTLSMYQSVQRGELTYIMPFKARADYEVDSFIAYELSIYKKRLVHNLDSFNGVEDIKAIINAIEEIDESLVPEDSLIREFIGGSSYKY